MPGPSSTSHLVQHAFATMALREFSEDEREVVELKIFSGLTFAEIASVLDRPAATVATWHRRAIPTMRQSLNSAEDP